MVYFEGNNMKNIRWSQLNIILAIVLGTAIGVSVLAGICVRSDKQGLELRDVEDLNQAWIVETEGEYDTATALPCNLEVNKGDTISISRYLPDEIPSDYGIAFLSVYNQVQITINGEVIYQYGVDEKHPFLSAPVPNWNMVAIGEQYAGQLMTITQMSNYGVYSGLFTEIQAGSRSALLLEQWRCHGLSVVLSVVLVLFALGLCMIAFMLKLQKKLDFRFWYYLILTIVITAYTTASNPLIMIYSRNAYFFWILRMLLRMAIPVVLLLFMRGFIEKKRMLTMIDGGMIAVSILYVGMVILQLMGLIELPVTYDILGFIYKLGFLALSGLMVAGCIRYRHTRMWTVTVANVLLCIAGVVNQFIRPNHLYQQDSDFWGISILIYLFLLLGAVLEVVIGQVDQKVQTVEKEYDNQRSMAVAMMNPNFLFSALNSLLAMTKAGSHASSKFVFAFSKYLRYNLDSIREDKMVSFEEELGYIAAYLEIQQMRMPELKVLIEDKLHDFQVPVRSIEPIVENAVKYGIGKNDNRGQVIIRSYERRDSYAIQVVDEGIGFDPDMLYLKETPTSMKTVRSRLEQTVHASIDVNSRLGKGTIITIRIPKHSKSLV
jgi:hypothetical protein